MHEAGLPRAKMATWKHEKMRVDEEFRLNHHLSNHKWARANPDYWKATGSLIQRKPKEPATSIIRNRERDRRRKEKASATPA